MMVLTIMNIMVIVRSIVKTLSSLPAGLVQEQRLTLNPYKQLHAIKYSLARRLQTLVNHHARPARHPGRPNASIQNPSGTEAVMAYRESLACGLEDFLRSGSWFCSSTSFVGLSGSGLQAFLEPGHRLWDWKKLRRILRLGRKQSRRWILEPQPGYLKPRHDPSNSSLPYALCPTNWRFKHPRYSSLDSQSEWTSGC